MIQGTVDENNDEDSEENDAVYENQECVVSDPNFMEALKYVRALFNYFRRSPVKMSELQKIIKADKEVELALLLDIRIRWNSILPMVKRYLEVRECIAKALDNWDENERFTNIHDDCLQELVCVLEPIQQVVLTLSKSDSNLLVAEGAMQFVLEKLKSLSSPIAARMFESLLQRYNERRNKDFLSLLMFLQTRQYPQNNSIFCYSSKAIIKMYAKDLSRRIFPSTTVGQADSATPENDENLSDIDKSISLFMTPSSSKIDSENLIQDLKIFEATGSRSDRLDILHKALLSLKPTSTDCERAFSIKGIFKNKTRNRLSSTKLNWLIWLKNFFN